MVMVDNWKKFENVSWSFKIFITNIYLVNDYIYNQIRGMISSFKRTASVKYVPIERWGLG